MSLIPMPESTLSQIPKVSVVIIALNEEARISKCLESVFNQDLERSNFEVILVDGGSGDRTREIAIEFGSRVVVEPVKGFGRARNRGAKESKAPIIAYIDADATAQKRWLRTLISEISDGVAATFGRVLEIPHSTWFSQTMNVLRLDQPNEMDGQTGVLSKSQGNNMAVRKDILIKVGGFDESLPGFEDRELADRFLRKGYNLKMVGDAITYHPSPRNLTEWMGDKFTREGVARGMLGRKNHEFGTIYKLRLALLGFSPVILALGWLIQGLFGLSAALVATLLGVIYFYRREFSNAVKEAFQSKRYSYLLYPEIRILGDFLAVAGYLLGYGKESIHRTSSPSLQDRNV